MMVGSRPGRAHIRHMEQNLFFFDKIINRLRSSIFGYSKACTCFKNRATEQYQCVASEYERFVNLIRRLRWRELHRAGRVAMRRARVRKSDARGGSGIKPGRHKIPCGLLPSKWEGA